MEGAREAAAALLPPREGEVEARSMEAVSKMELRVMAQAAAQDVRAASAVRGSAAISIPSGGSCCWALRLGDVAAGLADDQRQLA
jgi:hypothetical protein